MGANQIAAIVFAIMSFTFAGKQLATEPQYNLPQQQPTEVRVIMEDGTVLSQAENKVVKEIVVSQSPVYMPEPPKPSLVGPALLITLALLVFGSGNGD